MPDDIITRKQERFCQEYVKDNNGSQSAIRAGYAKSGCGVAANRLLKKDYIQQRIEVLTKRRVSAIHITVENILEDIVATRKTCAEKGDNANRLKANELLGKYHKMWVDRIENTQVKDGSEQSRKRLQAEIEGMGEAEATEYLLKQAEKIVGKTNDK